MVMQLNTLTRCWAIGCHYGNVRSLRYDIICPLIKLVT